MAWTSDGDALADGALAGTATSTSTVRLPALSGWSKVVGGSVLRMFGVDHRQLEASGIEASATAVGPGSVWTQRGLSAEGQRYQEWLEGDPVSRSFELSTTYETALPLSKSSQAWALEYVDSDGGVAVHTVEVDALYKDPSVVRLPDGSWLMVMARALVEPGEGTAHPGNSVGDVVAWLSPDASFAGEQVVGPFLLVSSLEAVSAGGVVRVWLGVPGAVVDSEGTELLVYYVAEESRSDDIGALERPPFDRYDSKSDYDAALAELDFERGIYLKRFSLAELLPWFEGEALAMGAVTDESGEDTAGGAYGREIVLPGTLAGRVTLSRSTPRGLGGATFEEVFDGLGEAAVGPQVADPQPAYGPSGRLHLYFAAVESEGGGPGQVFEGSGHGIWLATEVAGTGGTRFTFVPQTGEGGGAASQIAAASTGADGRTVVHLDPDPVELASGTWLVFSGQVWHGESSEGMLETGSLALQRYEGEEQDGDPEAASQGGLEGEGPGFEFVPPELQGVEQLASPERPGPGMAFRLNYWLQYQLMHPSFDLKPLWQSLSAATLWPRIEDRSHGMGVIR